MAIPEPKPASATFRPDHKFVATIARMCRWTGGVVAIMSAIFWWLSAVYQHTINDTMQHSMHGVGQHLNQMINFGFNANVAAAVSAVVAAILIFLGNELH